MSQIIFPPFKPVPDNASDEVRLAMFDSYKKELVRLNPKKFNADGTRKTFFQTIKQFLNDRLR
jgi:hypothetical protein